jgi:phage terminase large subunit-like protein
VSDALTFVKEQIVLADGDAVGDRLAADPWIERDLLAPAFARDEHGLPRHRLVYVELPRGHWKSGGVAAIGTAEAALHGSTDVVIAAADSDQARIVLENVDGYLARNPTLGALFRSKRDERLTDSGSRIRVISSDAPTAFGLGGTHKRFRLICDELTAWRDDALWIALISATGKVGDVQTLVLSNAGFDAERSWQWEVRKTAEQSDYDYLFAADGVIASWITQEWVERMRELLPSAAFDRLIGNEWTSGAGDFVTAEQWARCIDERLAPNARGRTTKQYAGLDLGLTKDRTALAIVHRDGDEVVLDELGVWQGTSAEPVSITVIERAVADAAQRFPGLQVSADPWQLKGSIERLRDQSVRIVDFTFSASSVQKLSATLHHAITSAALRVYPDRELEREILGLRVIETPSGWRFDHRSGAYSDRAVALAMAITAAQSARTGTMSTHVPRRQIPRRLDGLTYADRVAARRRAALERPGERELAATLGVGTDRSTAWHP